jgi:hypothetical protein
MIMKKYIPFAIAAVILVPRILTITNEIMYLKLFVQIIGLTILAIYSGIQFPAKFISDENGDKGATAIIFFAGTITFWMIPRSVDLTAQNLFMNYVMLGNLFFAGYFLGASLKLMPFVLKTAGIIYGLSMVLTMGMIYYVSKGLLCAVYTIEMQNTSGLYLLRFFPVLFISFLIFAAGNLKGISKN